MPMSIVDLFGEYCSFLMTNRIQECQLKVNAVIEIFSQCSAI